MSAHPFNPPAFPQHEFSASPQGGGEWTNVGGMTLRDWFAGQALTGFVSRGPHAYPDAAGIAYKYADAMLEQRSKS